MATASPHWPAAFQDEAPVLPLEILGGIFKIIFASSQVELKRPPSRRIRLRNDPPEKPQPPLIGWSPEEDLLSPNLFPYALSSVCAQWRAALSMEADYWTRVVIYVDASPTPLSDVRGFMAWSRDLPIDVTITRRTEGYQNHPDEAGHVAAVTKIIMPHLNRIRTLKYDVLKGSSLVTVTHEMKGSADLLTSLSLESSITGGRPYPVLPNIEKGGELSMPRLEHLTLAGCNMVDICSNPQKWINALSNVKDIWISHGVVGSLSTSDVLETLSQLRRLETGSIRMTEVDFTKEFNVANARPLGFRGSLHLEDVGDYLVKEIFTITEGWESVHIARSPINPIPQIGADFVRLEEISPTQDISGFVRDWDGGSLTLKDCPGFDDEAIARICDDGEDVSMAYIMLISLAIEDCPNFSPEGLKKLIELYQKRRLGGNVKSLVVRGLKASFSTEDLAWFSTNVEYFRCISDSIIDEDLSLEEPEIEA